MSRSAAATLLALLVAVPLPTSAQTRSPSPRRETTFQQLSRSQLVRVATPGLGRRVGRLLDQDTTALLIESDRQPLRVPAVRIDTLWTRGRSAGAGALIGAILGAGLGVVAGNQLGEENAGSAANVLGMAGIGAIGGSLAGTVIGAGIPRWQRRFP